MAAPMSRPTQLRATVLGAFLEGWRRVFQAPALVLGTWLATSLTALPLAGLLVAGVSTSSAWKPDPLHTMTVAGPDRPAALVTREIAGIGGALGWATRAVAETPGSRSAVVAAVAIHLLVWTFVSGVACDRLARGRPVGTRALAALGTRYFPRLLRLGGVAAAAYWALVGTIQPLLAGPVHGLAADLLGSPVAASTAITFLFAAVVALLTLLVDFTRVRIVVDDRFSVLASIAAAWRFVRRRPLRCATLYGLNLVALAAIARLFVQAVTDLSSAGWTALIAAELFVLARVIARLALLGSEAVFFQGELAHATYTAAPVPRWPESPAIEAIRNLRFR
jgi:hypothetical protein